MDKPQLPGKQLSKNLLGCTPTTLISRQDVAYSIRTTLNREPTDEEIDKVIKHGGGKCFDVVAEWLDDIVRTALGNHNDNHISI